MKKIRLIARLDVKNEYVIKGIHLEGLRKIGDPIDLATSYYKQGIDEIIFMDAVASLYDRNNLFHVIEKACEEVFIPITIGGGIRTIDDIDQALKAGADKIALNTAAIKNPEIIRKASEIYGSQCIIGSVEAKLQGQKWEAYTDNGREGTGVDVCEWVQKLEELGAGEIMLTSVDMEGTKNGFDIELIKQVYEKVKIPVIVSGGAGNMNHFKDLMEVVKTDAVAVASMLHYNMVNVDEIKSFFKENNLPIR